MAKIQLNEQQLKAVKHKGRNCVVIATAGSGKTSVLTERTTRLVKSGVDPEKILLITFTVKAAEEMQNRISSKLGKDLSSLVTCGTFHSWLHSILRKYSKVINLVPNFTIATPRDMVDLIKIFNNVTINSKEVSDKTMYNIISAWRNTRKPLNELMLLLGDRKNDSLPSTKEVEDFERSFDKFTKYKKEHAILDFDDILSYGYELLSSPSFKKKYSHVLVDEYQDCNEIQVDLVKKLYERGSEIFVVGDISQSIYAFRGSNYRHIQAFEKDFDAKKIILNVNYRCSNQILNLANAIGSRFKSDFYDMSGIHNKSMPDYIRTSSVEEQSQKIVNLIKDSGIPAKDIAVLYRSNSTSKSLEDALTKQRIPYTCKGNQDFFEKSHIRDIMALLRLTFFHQDVISWSRVLLLHRGVGKVSANSLMESIFKKGLSKLRDKDLKGLEIAIKDIKKHNKNPDDAIEIAINYLTPVMKSNSKYSSDFNTRQKDFSRIYSYSKPYSSIKSMITALSFDEEVEEETNGVTLSTVHSAKGLEWKYVIIASMTNDKFPCEYFLTGSKSEIREKVSEERRLFYVAVTRAINRLSIISPMDLDEYTCYCNTGTVKISKESMFIKEIEDLEELTVVEYPEKTSQIIEDRSFKHIRRNFKRK